jgi:predicted nucleic acid-binding protein
VTTSDLASGCTYWDTSAAISALIPDEYSEVAVAHAQSNAAHLLSSLTWAEVHAVIGRMERQRKISDLLCDAARNALGARPWRWINVVPDRKLIRRLAARWQLRGADLWHLAAAKTLRADLPELTLLTFDQQLGMAAKGEGLA